MECLTRVTAVIFSGLPSNNTPHATALSGFFLLPADLSGLASNHCLPSAISTYSLVIIADEANGSQNTQSPFIISILITLWVKNCYYCFLKNR